MISLQSRFFASLDEIAGKHGCEVVQEAEYANTGRVAIVRGYEPVVSFRYSFSAGHNVFESEQAFFATEPPAGSNPRMDIVRQPGDTPRVLDAIAKALKQAGLEIES